MTSDRNLDDQLTRHSQHVLDTPVALDNALVRWKELLEVIRGCVVAQYVPPFVFAAHQSTLAALSIELLLKVIILPEWHLRWFQVS